MALRRVYTRRPVARMYRRRPMMRARRPVIRRRIFRRRSGFTVRSRRSYF